MNAGSDAFRDPGDSQIPRAVTDDSPAQLPRIPQTVGSYEGLWIRHFDSNENAFPNAQNCCCLHFSCGSWSFGSSCLLGLQCVNRVCGEKLLLLSLLWVWTGAPAEAFGWLTSTPESISFCRLCLLPLLCVYTTIRDSKIGVTNSLSNLAWSKKILPRISGLDRQCSIIFVFILHGSQSH